MDEFTVKVCKSYCYDCGRYYDKENFESHHKRTKLGHEDSDTSSHEKEEEIDSSKPIDSMDEGKQQITEVEPPLVPETTEIVPTTDEIRIVPLSQIQDAEDQTENPNEENETEEANGKNRSEDGNGENQTNPDVSISLQSSQEESVPHVIYIPLKVLEEDSENSPAQPKKRTVSTKKRLQSEPANTSPSSCSTSPNTQVQTVNNENEENTTTPTAIIGVRNSTCTSSPILKPINVSKLKSYLHCSKCYETFSQISELMEHFDKCDVKQNLTYKEWKRLQYITENFKNVSTSTCTLHSYFNVKRPNTKDAFMVTDPIKVGVVNTGPIPVLRFGEKEIPLPFLTTPIQLPTATKPKLVDQSQQTEQEEEEKESLMPSEYHNDDTTDTADFPAVCSPLNSDPQVEDISLGENSPVFNEPYPVLMDDGKFKCSQCSKSFKEKASCKYHIRKHLPNVKRHQCPFCKYTCLDRKSLMVHFGYKHKNEEEYKCFGFSEICDLTFSSLQELKAHMIKHPKVKKIRPKRELLPCSKCGKKISIAMLRLEEHEKICTYGQEKVTPPPRVYPNKVKTHFCTQTGCSRAFWNSIDLDRHILRHEEQLTKGMEIHAVEQDGKKFYKCPTCSNLLLSGNALRSHLPIHDPNRRKFVCSVPECGKEFAMQFTLTKHTKKVHEGIVEEYLCSFCGACLHTKDSYRTHLRSHTGEKPWKCDIEGCGKGFHSRALFGSHKLTHTRDFKEQCKFCGKVFRNKAKVRIHELAHTRNLPMKCKFCDLSFRFMKALKAHVRRIHSKDYEFDPQDPKTFQRS